MTASQLQLLLSLLVFFVPAFSTFLCIFVVIYLIDFFQKNSLSVLFVTSVLFSLYRLILHFVSTLC